MTRFNGDSLFKEPIEDPRLPEQAADDQRQSINAGPDFAKLQARSGEEGGQKPKGVKLVRA